MFAMIVSNNLLAFGNILGVLAYVGPGLGAGAIAILIGLFTSIVLALFALVWYPFKRLLRLFRKKPDAAEESAPVDPT